MAMFIIKPWYRKKDDAIYGAEWAGTSSPSWTRTDAAVGFSDPNPYYAGMSSSPSSPFDNIMPWSGIRRVTDASAGELVEIPKFYYKWTRDGVKMKLQISMGQFDGSYVSPAHADRGDGVGERDYVYVGRYHCASDYKSKTGVTPIYGVSRPTCRNGVHNLGANIWQYDFAMRWTVNMLYLVEYANWNSQTCIGWGGDDRGSGGSFKTNGLSDSMPYHTGTIKTARTQAGAGIQYRYIENWWANCYEWCDGIYFSGSNVYGIKNPSNFSDSSGGTYIGIRTTSGGGIKQFLVPQATGFEYALYPSATYGESAGYDDYICDGTWNTGTVLDVGGGGYINAYLGAFYMDGYYDSSSASGLGITSRIMVLPPSRLSA